MDVRRLGVDSAARHGGGDSTTVVLAIDSAMRDAARWPTPSELAVPLDAPVHNVTGFDVLDATLQNGTYLVDVHNNRWSFGVRVGGSAADSDAPALLGALAPSRSFSLVMDDTAAEWSLVKVVGDAYAQPFTAVPVSAGSAHHVAFDVRCAASPASAAEVRAAQLAAPGSRAVPLAERPVVEWDAAAGAHVFRSAASAAPTGVSVSGGMALVEAGGGVYKVSFPDLARVPLHDFAEVVPGAPAALRGTLTLAVTPAFYASLDPAGPDVLHELQLHNVLLETGDHNIDTLVAALRTQTPNTSPSGGPVVSLSGTSAVNPTNYTRRRKARFAAEGFFWVDAWRSSAAGVLGFGVPPESPVPAGTPARARSLHGATWSAELAKFELVTPGVMNLSGTSFLRLRCPELEEHMHSPMVGALNPGVGVFKMYDSKMAHLRFDYARHSNVLNLPIAKLTRLTLRFERFDGSSFDFKGLNYHLLLSLTVQKPSACPR